MGIMKDERLVKSGDFGDADTNPQVAYELGRHDEAIAQRKEREAIVAENKHLTARLAQELAKTYPPNGGICGCCKNRGPCACL